MMHSEPAEGGQGGDSPPSPQCTEVRFASFLSGGFITVIVVKFIYSEKTTKFCKISTVDLSYVVPVKSTVEISQNFVAFSEYMNFTIAGFSTRFGTQRNSC